MLFLEKLEQKKFYIVLVMIICIIIGILYTICFVPQKYITEATFVCLKTEKNSAGKIQTNGSIELTDNMVSTFKEIAKSTLTIKEAQKSVNLDVKSKDISLKKISNSDTFSIQIKDEDSNKIVSFSNKFIESFSKKAEMMLSDAEIYVVDSPYIENKTYGNAFLISIGISILIGVAVIFVYIIFLIQFDKKIKSIKEVESEISLRNLISIPVNNKKRKTDLVFDEKSNSLSSKAFKTLRANIQFVNINNKGKNTILITSPKNSEGKSYIAANLAISFAEAGKKVMLIDADMNTGKQSKIFNIPNNLGLSNYLSNLDANGIEINELVNKFINETEFKNLNLITSGTIPPNSSELLASERLIELIKDLTVFYDVLIIDSGKVLGATDALILTRVVNSTILVSNYKKTNKDDLWQAKKDIQNVGGRIIGNILNKTKEKGDKKEKNIRKGKDIRKGKSAFEKITEKVKQELNKLKKYLLELKNKSSQKLLIEGDQHISEDKEIFENTINYIAPVEEIGKDETTKGDISNPILETQKQTSNVNISEDSIKENQDIVSNKNLTVTLENNLPEEKIQVSEETSEEINIYPETEVKVIYKNKDEAQEEKEPKVETSENSSTQNFENVKQKVKAVFDSSKDNLKRFIDNAKNSIQSSFSSIKKYKNKIEEDGEKYVAEDKEEKVVESKENISVTDTIIKDEETNKQENKNVIIDDLENNDEAILVIVDAENGYCRAFNKYCFTEKAVRGIDPVDGFNKANYSSYLLKKRIEDLSNLYGITKKQAERIDTLIYSTLIDYDDTVWLERKMISNKADAYAKCMAKDYDIIPGEENKEYERRCQSLRKQELRKDLIEIEYILDGLWKSKTINFTDKLVMNKFAGIYDSDSKLKFLKDKTLKPEEIKQNPRFEKIKQAIKNSKIKIEIIQKANKIKEKLSNLKVEQVKAKTVEEIQKEVLNENNDKSNDNYDNMSIDEYYNENKNLEEIDYKKLEEERKREIEFFKEQKREEKMIQKRIAMEEKKARNLEKKKKREELRKNKELEKQKQRQEAKIEEELLVDNLYPKTKNNKDI